MDGGVDSESSSSEHQLPILSPIQVGREFVRQYYRLLQKAPELMYRFYLNESTCTYDDSEIIMGKRDIRELFSRANYKDCRTKILHTDIHGTIENGVIVLVMGEQSNARIPMRSFVQTFVLAAHGPRRYYIYNDIFHFVEMRAEAPHSVDDAECQTTTIMHIGDGDQQDQNSSSDPYTTTVTTNGEKMKTTNYDTISEHISLTEGYTIPMPRWANARLNKDVSYCGQSNYMLHSRDDSTSSNTETIHFDEYTRQQQSQGESPFHRSLIAQALSPRMQFEDIIHSTEQYDSTGYFNDEPQMVSIGVSSSRATSKLRTDNLSNRRTQQQMYMRETKESNNNLQADSAESQDKVPTYAKLLMSAFTRAGLKNNNHTSSTNSSSIPTPLKATNMPLLGHNNGINDSSNLPSTSTSPGCSSPFMDSHEHNFLSNSNQGQFIPVQRNNYVTGMRRNDRRRASSAQKYDDNQQLFLGQIPHDATEEELTKIFSCFGNVLELRILPNLGGKIQPGAKHPLKYGFLTFEHVESVKTCLESRPVYYPNNTPDGQKLNVRAKKPSVSRDDGPPPCQSLDSQSMGGEWLKTASRRNNSASNNLSGNNAANVFSRKDNNRNNRGASLDNGPQSSSQATGGGSGGSSGGGSRKFLASPTVSNTLRR